LRGADGARRVAGSGILEVLRDKSTDAFMIIVR